MAMEKKFDAATAEAKIYAKWEDAKAFAAGANARDGKDSFSVMIPPPNVTGNLHIGHAFNNTLQDILIRWKRMQGFDTLWQPGTDHAGIATQMVVERKLAETQQPSRAEMGREAFLEKVWEWKAESGGTIINQLKRLGASCDWDREAFTMSGNFPDAVIKVFVEMYNKGLIYRGKRLVNWDPHFETAISDLEVENIEVAGHMWHFKYPLAGGATYTYEEKDEDGNVTLSEERDYISIATTRPETMLGDGAVAVHPTDERYAPIVGMLCEIPVGPKAQRRLIPIITDEYPDKDFGSGAVKITGAHDFNDYQVAKRGGIPMYSLMDTKGNMRADGLPYVEEATAAQAIANGKAEFTEASIAAMNMVPEEYRGLDRFEARKAVIADITAEGLAVMVDQTSTDDEGNETTTSIPYVENKPVMQPFGDRSKVVIEPMLTDQWFVDTAKIVGPALDAVKDGTVKIIPESGEKVYYHWLENIEPWCISRQLWWGHQIPVWFDADGNQFCATTEAEAQAKAGSGVELTRDPDVLDTWFSSGLWPIGTLGWPEETDALEKYFPTSTLITGQDILFFWVARMMMMQLAVVDEIPFDTVYLHGLVRDAKGKKMSKSTGNVIDPLDIIDEFGADALRFTNASMASIGGALKLDTQRIAGYRNFGTKLWNAASYGDFKGSFDLPHSDAAPETILPLNKWIKGEIAKTLEVVNDALAAFRFNDAANALYAFVWGTFCSQYLEYTKPVLDGDDAAAAAETLATYAWALDQCLILMHPIMPFITEEIWAQKSRPKMLIHTDWPEYTAAEMVDTKADTELNWVTKMIETIRSVRTQMRVPASAFIPLAVQGISPEARSAWDQNASLITRLARIETLTEVETFESGAVTLGVSGGTFALPLADVIDVAEEKARLENTMKKLEKEIGGMKGRLNNPNFVASAPDEVVEETRANLASKEEEAAKLKIALGQLA